MVRYVACILVAVSAVVLTGSIVVVLGQGVADCLAGRPEVRLTAFDGVGTVGGHPPRIRAVIEGPQGPRPLGEHWLVVRFPDGWTEWGWVSGRGLTRPQGPRNLAVGPHRFRVGMPELHPRLDVVAWGTVWIWPRDTRLLWVDASALVPPPPGRVSGGDAALPPPAARAGLETLKTLATRCRCVYLVAEDARGYAAARRWLQGRGAPAGPAFWVIPGRETGRLKGLVQVWPVVEGAVAASDDLARAVERVGLPLERVPPASAPAGPARDAWRRARLRFAGSQRLGRSNGR